MVGLVAVVNIEVLRLVVQRAWNSTSEAQQGASVKLVPGVCLPWLSRVRVHSVVHIPRMHVCMAQACTPLGVRTFPRHA